MRKITTETDWSHREISDIADLVQFFESNPNVLVQPGPLRTQGRMTFGYEHTGAEGIGLYILFEENDENE